VSGWRQRRFWKAARAQRVAAGWEVRLDSRVLRTPAKAPLILPSQALAEAIAAEWAAQTGEIDPATMPLTRIAHSAIDKVAPAQAEVAALIAAYGESDLLCYRAEGTALAERQAEAWDPVLAWSASRLAAPLAVTCGVIHVQQAAASLARLRAEVAAFDAFALAAFHDLVALSGSLLLALAVIKGFEPADALWERSRVDENWQEEHWGRDEEAAESAAMKRRDFLLAADFLGLLAATR